MNPIHDAADEVPVVESILREFYPDRDRRQIRDRALQIPARRHVGVFIEKYNDENITDEIVQRRSWPAIFAAPKMTTIGRTSHRRPDQYPKKKKKKPKHP